MTENQSENKETELLNRIKKNNLEYVERRVVNNGCTLIWTWKPKDDIPFYYDIFFNNICIKEKIKREYGTIYKLEYSSGKKFLVRFPGSKLPRGTTFRTNPHIKNPSLMVSLDSDDVEWWNLLFKSLNKLLDDGLKMKKDQVVTRELCGRQINYMNCKVLLEDDNEFDVKKTIIHQSLINNSVKLDTYEIVLDLSNLFLLNSRKEGVLNIACQSITSLWPITEQVL